MSRASRQQVAKAPPPTPTKSDSVPVGMLRLSGIVKTTNGFAVATVELSLAEWHALASKKLGRSQAFPEHVALEHKQTVMKLGQLAQLQRAF